MPTPNEKLECVKRDAAGSVAGRQAVGERLEAWHIGTGKADACDPPNRSRRPKTVS